MTWMRRGGSGGALPLFALAHIVISAVLFRGIYALHESGTPLYYTYAGNILAGQLPYRDFVAEYPPIALAFFVLPRLARDTFGWYFLGFHALITAVDVLVLVVLSRAARAWQLPERRVLGAYTIAILAVGPITIEQFDLLPALFTLLALLEFSRKRETLAGAWLGVGAMTKVYPVLLAPLLVADAWQRGRKRQTVWAAAAFAGVCLAAALPWLLRSPDSLRVMLSYHVNRGIQIESTWSTLSFLGRALGLTWIDVSASYGSLNISGPLPDLLVPVSGVVMVVALLVTYWRVTRRSHTNAASLARAATIVLLVALATSKTFSPQYLLWVVPGLALLDRESGRVAIGLFAVIGALTQYVFPYHYEELPDRHLVPLLALALRNVLVIVLAVRLARSGRAASSREVPA
jgi:hypothetical protein